MGETAHVFSESPPYSTTQSQPSILNSLVFIIIGTFISLDFVIIFHFISLENVKYLIFALKITRLFHHVLSQIHRQLSLRMGLTHLT